MSGADEKIRAVLERVARRVAIHIYLQITDDAIAQVEGELERELLPLLLAGQAMRDSIVDYHKSTSDDQLEAQKWYAALAAAQGQPENTK